MLNGFNFIYITYYIVLIFFLLNHFINKLFFPCTNLHYVFYYPLFYTMCPRGVLVVYDEIKKIIITIKITHLLKLFTEIVLKIYFQKLS